MLIEVAWVLVSKEVNMSTIITINPPLWETTLPADHPHLKKSVAALQTEHSIHLNRVTQLIDSLQQVVHSNLNVISTRLTSLANEIKAVHEIKLASKKKYKEAETSWCGPIWGERLIYGSHVVKVAFLVAMLISNASEPFLNSDKPKQLIVIVVLSSVIFCLALCDAGLNLSIERKKQEMKKAKKLSKNEIWQIGEQILPLMEKTLALIAAVEGRKSNKEISSCFRKCIKIYRQINTNQLIKDIAPIEEWVSIFLAKLSEEHPLRQNFAQLSQKARELRQPATPFIPQLHETEVNSNVNYSPSSPVMEFHAFHQGWQQLTREIGAPELNYIQLDGHRVNWTGKVKAIPEYVSSSLISAHLPHVSDTDRSSTNSTEI